MLIWLSFVLPVLIAVFARIKYHKAVTWLEFAIMMAVPAALIAITAFTTKTMQIKDVEYWGGVVGETRYYEDWNERVSCRHPKFCTRTVRVGKRMTTQTYVCGYWHAYDVDNHPPYWEILDNMGGVYGITQVKYRELVGRFGNETFKELRRNYHTNDGDMYYSSWPKTYETSEITSTWKWYENRVQASSSIHNFPTVDPKKLKLYEYPDVKGYNQEVILGDFGPARNKESIHRLAWLNGNYGSSCAMRVFALSFKNRPMKDALDQQAYWKNANKNEIVVCVGLDKDYDVTWCHVFGWTHQEDLKIKIRDYMVSTHPVSLEGLGIYVETYLNDIKAIPPYKYPKIRRDFDEFNYINVEPPMWVILVTFLVTLGVSVGICIHMVNNEYTNER